MEFHIDRDPFLKMLSRIQTVVERRNTMPILGNALLEVREQRLTVSATDLEVSLRTTCVVEVDIPGRLAVNAKTLFEIVRELPPGSIRLRQDAGNRLRLVSGRARFDLAGLSGEEFPEIPHPDGNDRYLFENAVLAKMFAETHFAMSYDDSRFTLNGIFLQFTPASGEDGESARMRMVATDTHRLAMVDKDLASGSSEGKEVIIPKKAVHEIRKILDDDSQDVELIMGSTHIQFVKPDITLISKLVQGRFPDYQRVIPEQNNLKLNVARRDLDSVVKRISVLSHEKSRGIRLQVSENQMKISSNNPEQEAGEEEMVVSFDGEKPFSIGFNARYLREILTAMQGDQVRFVLKDETSPALVFDPDQKDALFVLMPMRV